MMIACGAVEHALMYARMAVEFPLVMFRDYIFTPCDRNVFKRQLSGVYTIAQTWVIKGGILKTGLW